MREREGERTEGGREAGRGGGRKGKNEGTKAMVSLVVLTVHLLFYDRKKSLSCVLKNNPWIRVNMKYEETLGMSDPFLCVQRYHMLKTV